MVPIIGERPERNWPAGGARTEHPHPATQTPRNDKYSPNERKKDYRTRVVYCCTDLRGVRKHRVRLYQLLRKVVVKPLQQVGTHAGPSPSGDGVRQHETLPRNVSCIDNKNKICARATSRGTQRHMFFELVSVRVAPNHARNVMRHACMRTSHVHRLSCFVGVISRRWTLQGKKHHPHTRILAWDYSNHQIRACTRIAGSITRK